MGGAPTRANDRRVDRVSPGPRRRTSSARRSWRRPGLPLCKGRRTPGIGLAMHYSPRRSDPAWISTPCVRPCGGRAHRSLIRGGREPALLSGAKCAAAFLFAPSKHAGDKPSAGVRMCGPRLSRKTRLRGSGAKSGDLRQINAARFGLDLDARNVEIRRRTCRKPMRRMFRAGDRDAGSEKGERVGRAARPAALAEIVTSCPNAPSPILEGTNDHQISWNSKRNPR